MTQRTVKKPETIIRGLRRDLTVAQKSLQYWAKQYTRARAEHAAMQDEARRVTPSTLEARARKLAEEFGESWAHVSGWPKENASALVSLLMRMAAPGEAEADYLREEISLLVRSTPPPIERDEVWSLLERARQAREEAERNAAS